MAPMAPVIQVRAESSGPANCASKIQGMRKMSKHHESLWAKILRFFMPANGIHARPHETGEMPVLDDDYDFDPETYDEWSPGDEEYPDPFYDGDEYDEELLQAAESGDLHYGRFNPRETRMDLPVINPDTPLVRPFLNKAA